MLPDDIWVDERLSFAETLLYDSVRLVVRAATKGGTRYSLAWVNDLVFRASADELEAQGVPRKVAAVMHGITPRSYHRRLAALEPRPASFSLWTRAVATLRDGPVTTDELVGRLAPIEPRIIRSIANDLRVAQLVEENDDGRLVLVTEAATMDDDELERFVQGQRLLGDLDMQLVSRVTGRSVADIEVVVQSLRERRSLQVKDAGSSIWTYLNLLGLQFTHYALHHLGHGSDGENGMSYIVAPIPDGDDEYRASLVERMRTQLADFQASGTGLRAAVGTTAARWAYIFTVGEQVPLRERSPQD